MISNGKASTACMLASNWFSAMQATAVDVRAMPEI
jgi:hypothetical protein